MPGDFLPLVLGAFATFVRVGGVFAFVPMPGAQAGGMVARVVLTLAVTLSLASRWPGLTPVSTGTMVVVMFREAALGIAIGLVVAFATELLLVAFQMLSLQAGYSFASTVDPTTQADAAVLQVFAQLASGLMFFTMGLHRSVIGAFVHSLDTHPAGSASLNAAMAPEIVAIGSSVFSAGLRLALPVIGFLMIVDVSLALMGRINSHLQMVLLAFPVKMIMTLGLLGALMVTVPVVYGQFLEKILTGIAKLVSGSPGG